MCGNSSSAFNSGPAPNVVARKTAPVPVGKMMAKVVNNSNAATTASGIMLESIQQSNKEDSNVNQDVKMDISLCHKCDLLFISKEEFLAHRF